MASEQAVKDKQRVCTADTNSASQRLLLGVVFICTSSIVFPIMNGVVQVLSPRYPTDQIVWVRTGMHLLFMLALFAPRRGLLTLLRTSRPGWQFTNSLLLVAATILFFSGVKHMHLASASAVSLTAPLFVAALAWPVLGERISMARLVAAVAGFVGVLIVIRPGTSVFHPASLYIVGSALCYALYQLFSRKIAGYDLPETSACYSALIGTLVMTATAPVNAVAFQSTQDALLMLSLGLFGGLGYYCVARALTYAPANFIAPFQYVQLIGSVIVGYLVSSAWPDAMTWLGSAVIIGAGIYMWWQESRDVSSGTQRP